MATGFDKKDAGNVQDSGAEFGRKGPKAIKKEKRSNTMHSASEVLFIIKLLAHRFVE